MNKGFARPQEFIQKRTVHFELKRYFPRDGSELDRNWVKVNLRVIDAPGKLYSEDWNNLMLRVAALFLDAYRYPKNNGSVKVPNHLFVHDALKQDVLAQLGLNPFDTSDKVQKIEVPVRG